MFFLSGGPDRSRVKPGMTTNCINAIYFYCVSLAKIVRLRAGPSVLLHRRDTEKF
jgi:hypothetical protein